MGHENNHLHLLVEARLRYLRRRLCKFLKVFSAKQIFKKFPEIKEELFGDTFGMKADT